MDCISLENQWKFSEFATPGDWPTETHFVEKPMEFHRIHVSQNGRRAQNFDEKPLVIQRNEEIEENHLGIKFR